MNKLMKQLGKSACYLALFLGSQYLVSLTLQLVYGYRRGLEIASGGAVLDEQALTQDIIIFVYENMTTITFLSGLLTLLVLWLFFLMRKKNIVTEANITGFSAKYMPSLILLGIALQILIYFGLLLFPSEIQSAYTTEFDLKMSASGIIAILAQVVVAPIVEEIVFRGLILSRLQKAMPTVAAVLLSSAAFGLVHGQVLWTSYTFLLGIVFAIAAIKTDSLLPAMMLHALFNILGVILSSFTPAITSSISTTVCLVLTAVGAALSGLSLYVLMKKRS